MAVDGMKKPLFPHCIKRTEETPNVKIQLTVTPSKFYQTEQTHRPFLSMLLTFSLSHNDAESKRTYETASEQKSRQTQQPH